MRNVVLLMLLLTAPAHAAAPSLLAEAYVYGVKSDLAPFAIGTDLRPQLEWRPTEKWRFIARPRFRVRSSEIAKFQIDDLNISYSPTEALTLTAGIENFQWGPAELASPSNPLFHLQLEQRSILFRQRGLVLARATYSISPNLVVMAIVEPLDYRPFTWIAGERFVPRALLRIERRFENAGNYVGLTAGFMEASTWFCGLYGNAYLDDSLSVYTDARLSFTSPALVPEIQGDGLVAFVKDRTAGPQLLATAGLRYEGFLDARLEYIFNGFGYSEAQWGLALSGLFHRLENPGRFREPGLELPKRNYLYLSLRTDRLGKRDELRLAARAVLSLQDGSVNLALPVAEWSFSDNFTALLQPMVFLGSSTSELRQGPRYEILAGLRASL